MDTVISASSCNYNDIHGNFMNTYLGGSLTEVLVYIDVMLRILT